MEAQHGKDQRYRNGCRCPKCMEGNRVRSAQCKVAGDPTRVHLGRDVDPIVVERVIAGDRLPMGVHERAIAIARMNTAGWSATAIARAIGCSSRTVHRHRTGKAKVSRV